MRQLIFGEALVNEILHVFPVMTYDIDFAGVVSRLSPYRMSFGRREP